jgi:hypothetical protein
VLCAAIGVGPETIRERKLFSVPVIVRRIYILTRLGVAMFAGNDQVGGGLDLPPTLAADPGMVGTFVFGEFSPVSCNLLVALFDDIIPGRRVSGTGSVITGNGDGGG